MLSILSYLFLSLSSWAYNTQDLIKVIQDHQLKSVDEVIPFLPIELRSQYTLQYQGFGLQGATFEKPRAILFGKDGKFILTFNSDVSQHMGNDLEILEFNETEKEFELYLLAFEEGKLQSAEKNPAKCMECHSAGGGKPFPIWGRYPSWRGAYGSGEDRIYGKETKYLAEFMGHSSSHPRYKYLEPLKGSPVSPFSSEAVQTMSFRPNANMGSYLARLNAVSLAKVIREQEDFEKYMLVAGPHFFNCRTKMDPQVLEKLNLELERAYLAKKVSRKFPHKKFSDLENLSSFLGSNTYAFGQLSYGTVNQLGEIVPQTDIIDPYFFDVFFLTTPNYLLGQLPEFFVKYPELKASYEEVSLYQRLKTNPRLYQTAEDDAILKTYDELGKGFFLKDRNCQPFETLLKKEFNL